MFMRYAFFISSLLILASCAQKEPEIPEDVMTEQEMVTVLQEIYLTEAKISKLSLPFDSSKSLYDMVEKELFRRNAVEDPDWERSMDWYYAHPEKLMGVYEVLVDSLMVLEKRHQDDITRGVNRNEGSDE